MIKYILHILKHKWYVFLASRRVAGIPLWRIIIHDLSKFSPAEVPAYKDRLLNDGKIRDRVKWAYAWHHHQKRNPHHWEYWTFFWHAHGDENFYNGIIVNNCIEIPETYLREMVADWMAASMIYTGSWDITEFVADGWSKMRLHAKSRILLQKILAEQGYWTIPTVKIWRFMSERAVLLDACNTALKHLTGRAEKFSEREKRPVLWKLREALQRNGFDYEMESHQLYRDNET